MTRATLLSAARCALGEGAFWHPEREELFWFDIVGQRLHGLAGGAERQWSFPEPVSAAGWIDRETLLIASAVDLFRFDLTTGARESLIPLEADDPVTRSNDGRADPWGGFWIGTMGRRAEPRAGAIYRYVDGALTRLVDRITIPNAICFAPDRSAAYWADTADGRIRRQPLDAEGWPEGAAETLVDLRGTGANPDGAVTDAGGCLWNAQWGASRVARYAPDGRLLSVWDLPTPQASCPAFGGAELTTLYVTTAAEGGLPAPAGATFAIETGIAGRPEPRVIA